MGRILIVDDNEKIRLVTRLILEKAGHDILEASSGEDALDMLEKGDIPDLVILDVMMPGENGWEICETIKSNEKTRDLPVVILTAKTSGKDMDQSSLSRADAHISKPFDMEYLLDVAERLIRKNPAPKVQPKTE